MSKSHGYHVINVNHGHCRFVTMPIKIDMIVTSDKLVIPFLTCAFTCTRSIVIKPFQNKLWFFTCLQKKTFENTVRKEEIARNEQFLLFPTVFSTILENSVQFSSNLKLSSANSPRLQGSKICRLGKG